MPLDTYRLSRLRPYLYHLTARQNLPAKHSPRGSKTYLPAAQFTGNSSHVIEVVDNRSIVLPLGSEVADDPGGPWRKLFNV